MSDMWDWAARSLREAQKTVEAAAAGTVQAAQTAATSAARVVSDAAAQLSGTPASSESTTLDWHVLPEATRAAFYGAMFAIANADGHIDKDELTAIISLLDLEGMSSGGQQLVQSFVVEPPRLLDTLEPLRFGDTLLRSSVMVNLVEVASAHDLIATEQRYALETAAPILQITPEQLQAIEQFVHEVKGVRERGSNDTAAAATIKQAAAGLTAVGVPIAAVYLSGSVIGLSAAGITSGLAALGLGLGMVPGIGVAVLLGTAVYLGVSSLLRSVGAEENEKLREDAERRWRHVREHIEAMIRGVSARIRMLEQPAVDATNTGAVYELRTRLRALQQIQAEYEQTA